MAIGVKLCYVLTVSGFWSAFDPNREMLKFVETLLEKKVNVNELRTVRRPGLNGLAGGSAWCVELRLGKKEISDSYSKR